MNDYVFLFWTMLLITLFVTTYCHFLVKHCHKRIAKQKAKLDAVHGLRRYTVTPESDDMYRLSSVGEEGWTVGTVVLNTELQAALNGEGK